MSGEVSLGYVGYFAHFSAKKMGSKLEGETVPQSMIVLYIGRPGHRPSIERALRHRASEHDIFYIGRPWPKDKYRTAYLSRILPNSALYIHIMHT
jgi:hypothetical protein